MEAEAEAGVKVEAIPSLKSCNKLPCFLAPSTLISLRADGLKQLAVSGWAGAGAGAGAEAGAGLGSAELRCRLCRGGTVLGFAGLWAAGWQSATRMEIRFACRPCCRSSGAEGSG